MWYPKNKDILNVIKESLKHLIFYLKHNFYFTKLTWFSISLIFYIGSEISKSSNFVSGYIAKSIKLFSNKVTQGTIIKKWAK